MVERLTYFIITRKLFESPIWSDSPHVLKLFLYLIGKARHRKEPKRFPGFEVCRGELVTSLSQIADDNEYLENRKLRKWNRMRVSRMLKYLDKMEYIKILCDTYGTHIKVLNYSTYQSPETYRCDNGVTTVLQPCYADVTQVLPYNNDKNVNNDNKELYSLVTSHLNEVAGKKYKSTSRKTQSLINARINDGFALDDFIMVINNQCQKWLNDSRMCQYLRPETLFGTKFESYLNNTPKKTDGGVSDITVKNIQVLEEWDRGRQENI